MHLRKGNPENLAIFNPLKFIILFSAIPDYSCLENYNNFSACVQHFPDLGLQNYDDSYKLCQQNGGTSNQLFDSTSQVLDYKLGKQNSLFS